MEYVFIAMLLFLLFQQIKTVDRILPLHGRFVMKFYTDNQCTPKKTEAVIGSINKEKNICIILKQCTLKVVQWDYYSNSMKFIITEKNVCENNDKETEEKILSLLCNGSCLKNPLENNKDNENMYYTCVFNNIIESAEINITLFRGEKQCHEANEIEKNTYKGKELCWSDSNGSILPVYWDDDRKRLFYVSLPLHTNCEGGSLNVSNTYFTCNGNCFNHLSMNDTSYTCNFANQETNICLNCITKLLYIFFLVIIFN